MQVDELVLAKQGNVHDCLINNNSLFDVYKIIFVCTTKHVI
jgi:hypothetical protein